MDTHSKKHFQVIVVFSVGWNRVVQMMSLSIKQYRLFYGLTFKSFK